jgi:hypothetical protein
MRESVLRDLASQAATDPDFLRQARRDPEGTLARYGYHLTAEEMRMVEDLRRRTSAMTDEKLARVLVSTLRVRSGSPPARPAAPSWRGSGPARPARPGG